MSEEDEPQYICLNYCMVDQETGYCLTCGRPPLPPPSLDFSQTTFAGISLTSKPVSVAPTPESQEDTAPTDQSIPGNSGN